MPPLPQDEIRAKYEMHSEQIRMLEAECEGNVGVHRAHIRRYQLQCGHPSKYEASCMGELFTRCPDCGWAS